MTRPGVSLTGVGSSDTAEPPIVLVVDDDERALVAYAALLDSLGYRTETARDGVEAIHKVELGPDLVVLDADMPHIDGFQVAGVIRGVAACSELPIIMVTGHASLEDRRRAFGAGVSDFLSKPVDPVLLRLRSTSLIELKRAGDELRRHEQLLRQAVADRTTALRASLNRAVDAERRLYAAHLDTIRRLAVAAEYKDKTTAGHIERVGLYAGILAADLELSPAVVEAIRLAAPMHDIGKIGIPDEILLKAGGLDEVEWAVMRKHTTFGARLLEGSDSEVLRIGENIALSHHEKWNGSGYPQGLKGTDIPLEARICAVVDYFDAVTMPRPYRGPLPVDDAVAYVREDEGLHFDPELRDAFLRCLPRILEARERAYNTRDSVRFGLPASLDELE